MLDDELDRREREIRLQREELKLERDKKVNGILNNVNYVFKWITLITIIIVEVVYILAIADKMFFESTIAILVAIAFIILVCLPSFVLLKKHFFKI